MDDHDRDEIEALLPWHATGTLTRAEAAKVEAALKADPELARRFAAVCEEMGDVVEVNESLGVPSARAMDALFAKIDAEPARRPPLLSGLGARIGAFFASLTPRTLAWSAAALALVIAAQAAVIGSGMLNGQSGGKPGFQIATGPTAPATPGAYVLVRFSASASSADVTQFLTAHRAQIVEGPKPGDLYRVRVAGAVRIGQAA